MPINESIEYFPLFNPQTESDSPGAAAAIGNAVAALGAPDALGGAGAVVLYSYSAAKNAWGYVGVLTGSSIEGTEQVRALGSSCVAFGDTVIVGARGDAKTPGRAFVLSPPYGAWSYTSIPVIAEIARSEPTKGDSFGASIAHCFDGTADYVAVGAPDAAPPLGVSGVGQVFIFRGLGASNTPWSTTPIVNRDPAGSATDRFGASVAINPAGGGTNQPEGTLTLAVGAPGAYEGQGAVYVGRTTEAGSWTSPFRFGEAMVPTFPDAADDFRTSGFGTSVAMIGGVTLAVGSPSDPNFADQIEGTGAVWIYSYREDAFVATDGGASIYGPSADSKFGTSVAFSEAGRHLVVGAPGAGRAYRYISETGDGSAAFIQDAEYASLVGKAGDRFGAAVAASTCPLGSWCLVGAPGNPKAQLDGGGFLYVDGEPVPTWMDTPRLIAQPPLRWGGMPPDWWKKWTPQIPKYLS
jgi:hypothetical protein